MYDVTRILLWQVAHSTEPAMLTVCTRAAPWHSAGSLLGSLRRRLGLFHPPELTLGLLSVLKVSPQLPLMLKVLEALSV